MIQRSPIRPQSKITHALRGHRVCLGTFSDAPWSPCAAREGNLASLGRKWESNHTLPHVFYQQISFQPRKNRKSEREFDWLFLLEPDDLLATFAGATLPWLVVLAIHLHVSNLLKELSPTQVKAWDSFHQRRTKTGGFTAKFGQRSESPKFISSTGHLPIAIHTTKGGFRRVVMERDRKEREGKKKG